MPDVDIKLENNRVLISVDGEPWREGSVSILTRRPHLPKVCVILEELSAIYAELEYKGAKRYACKKLAAQSLCSFDLVRSLTLKLVSQEITERIVKELDELGYLNDQAWMESFIRLQQQRHVGSKIIAHKLRLKGFSEEQIKAVLQGQSEEEAIKSLIKKRYASKDMANYSERNKVVAALARKGFSLEQILAVVRRSDKRL